MSHGTHVNESCHTCEWVMSQIRMSYVAHMNESCQWVAQHMNAPIWHTSHVSESWHTCECLGSSQEEVGDPVCPQTSKSWDCSERSWGFPRWLLGFTKLGLWGPTWTEKNPPPGGGFPIYYVPSSRTVSKRTPLKEPGTNSSRKVLLLTVLDEGGYIGNPLGGRGFFRSSWASRSLACEAQLHRGAQLYQGHLVKASQRCSALSGAPEAQLVNASQRWACCLCWASRSWDFWSSSVMAHMWISHGTHVNESWHTCERVMAHIRMSSRHVVTHSRHISLCHVTHMNESYHIYAWVMAHTWMSHGTDMHESWHTYEWVVMAQDNQRLFELDVKLKFTHHWIMSYMSHISHGCVTYVSHRYHLDVSHTWQIMSHIYHIDIHHIDIFIGKVVFNCLRVSVNLVYKFQGNISHRHILHRHTSHRHIPHRCVHIYIYVISRMWHIYVIWHICEAQFVTYVTDHVIHISHRHMSHRYHIDVSHMWHIMSHIHHTDIHHIDIYHIDVIYHIPHRCDIYTSMWYHVCDTSMWYHMDVKLNLSHTWMWSSIYHIFDTACHEPQLVMS